jgi:alcohol dehydrogenase class IV
MIIMLKFKFSTVQQIIFGGGSFQKLGEEAKKLQARKVLLVIDKKLCEMGLGKKALNILKGEKINAVLFEQGEVEPELEVADKCTQFGKDNACDFVIGIGGGSTLDTAKAAAVLMTNDGPASEYQGFDKVKNPGLKTIMIPTTAGTGSEVTPTAVFINREKGIKLGINSPYVFPTLALLDPELTVSLPANITASTGMDALTHAIESYVGKAASPVTDIFSLKAMELIWAGLPIAVKDGRNISARSKTLLGSCLAGVAITNAGTGASHAISYALSVLRKVPHGVSNGILIPHVMEYNHGGAIEKFVILAQKMGVSVDKLAPKEAALAGCARVAELTQEIGIPKHLGSFGITEVMIPQLASMSMQLTGAINNNPRLFTDETVMQILRKVL